MRIESDKTDHARMFALNAGVAAALRRYKELKGAVGQNDLVLTIVRGKLPDMDHLAALLRSDLQKSGIARNELFAAHGSWGRLNAHVLRHSYVTRSLARGVPEDAVRQRSREELLHQHLIVTNFQALGRTEDAESLLAKLQPDDIDFLVIDEAHIAASASYQRLLDRFPQARVLFMSACFRRLDGKPMRLQGNQSAQVQRRHNPPQQNLSNAVLGHRERARGARIACSDPRSLVRPTLRSPRGALAYSAPLER